MMILLEKELLTPYILITASNYRLQSFFEYDKLTQKLYYLKDETGKWVKSKLKDFKLNKVLTSSAD